MAAVIISEELSQLIRKLATLMQTNNDSALRIAIKNELGRRSQDTSQVESCLQIFNSKHEPSDPRGELEPELKRGVELDSLTSPLWSPY